MTSSFATTDIVIDDVRGKVYLNESAQSVVFKAFSDDVKQLQKALFPTSLLPPLALDKQRQAQAEEAIIGLRNLLMFGIRSSSGRIEYMTKDMALQLGVLFHSLSLAHIDPTAQPFSLGSLQKAQVWQSLVAPSVLSGLFSIPTSGNHSLQALVELAYVKTANEVLSEQLSALEEALSISKGIMNNLTSLQTLHNKITIPTRPPFDFNLVLPTLVPPIPNPPSSSADIKRYAAAYTSAASAYFHKPIAPVPLNVPTASGFVFQAAEIPAHTSAILPGALSVAKTVDLINALGNLQKVPPYTPFAGEAQKLKPGIVYFASPASDPFSWNIRGPDGNIVLSDVTFADMPDLERFSFVLAKDASAATPFINDINNKTNGIYSAAFKQTTISAESFSSPLGIIKLSASVGPLESLNIFAAAAAKLQANLKFLSSSYPGIINTDKPEVANALSIFQSSFAISYQALPNTISLPLTWLGFNATTKTYKIDTTHDPAALEQDKLLLIQMRSALSAQAEALLKLNPDIGSDENSLLGRIKAVLKDIHATFITSDGKDITRDTSLSDAIAGITKWLVDNYNVSPLSQEGAVVGAFQQNLNTAITASQNLNNSQNENVRNFLFIFEEYYKSASAILQQLTQMIQTVAKNIHGA